MPKFLSGNVTVICKVILQARQLQAEKPDCPQEVHLSSGTWTQTTWVQQLGVTPTVGAWCQLRSGQTHYLPSEPSCPPEVLISENSTQHPNYLCLQSCWRFPIHSICDIHCFRPCLSPFSMTLLSPGWYHLPHEHRFNLPSSCHQSLP